MVFLVERLYTERGMEREWSVIRWMRWEGVGVVEG